MTATRESAILAEKLAAAAQRMPAAARQLSAITGTSHQRAPVTSKLMCQQRARTARHADDGCHLAMMSSGRGRMRSGQPDRRGLKTLTGNNVDKFTGPLGEPGPGGALVLQNCPSWALPTVASPPEGGNHACVATEPVTVHTGGPFTPIRLSQATQLLAGHDNQERTTRPRQATLSTPNSHAPCRRTSPDINGAELKPHACWPSALAGRGQDHGP
jgi:hypothetical protein